MTTMSIQKVESLPPRAVDHDDVMVAAAVVSDLVLDFSSTTRMTCDSGAGGAGSTMTNL